MSILDKHPAPWTFDGDTYDFVDSNGHAVHPAKAKRLILAAPELLAVVKAFVANPAGGASWAKAVQDGADLIARIEGGK